jgi:hypothetical protein
MNPPADLSPEQQLALADYFGGDRQLFERYTVECHKQFVVDIRSGDEAAALPDLAKLRHLGHNLKTVLRSLGLPLAGAQAAALELACMEADAPAAQRHWVAVRQHLQQPAP